jgi:hypothetical protein
MVVKAWARFRNGAATRLPSRAIPATLVARADEAIN